MNFGLKFVVDMTIQYESAFVPKLIIGNIHGGEYSCVPHIFAPMHGIWIDIKLSDCCKEPHNQVYEIRYELGIAKQI